MEQIQRKMLLVHELKTEQKKKKTLFWVFVSYDKNWITLILILSFMFI